MKKFLIVLGVFTVWLTSLPAVPSMAHAPKHGGRLIIATQQDPITLNGAVSTHLHTHMITDAMTNCLLRMKWNDPNVYPDLAESWEVSDDGKTYTFHLVKNAKWHDGKAFTSADVKFSIEEVLLKHNPAGKIAYGSLDRVETPDAYTAVVHLKNPFAAFPLYISNKYYGTMVPKHLYEGTDIKDNPHNFKPVGTGPFKFDKYEKGSYIRVIRNEDYFKEGQPYLDEIVFRITPDWSAQVAAFETGEINYLVFSIPRHELPRLAKLPGVKVDIMTPLNNGALWTRFNLRHAALKKQKVREALQWATDKSELLEKAYYGQGWVSHGFINPDNPIVAWAYNPDVPKYGYDPEKAKQLLDEAGFPPKDNGVRFSIRQYSSASDIEAGKANEILREQWRQVGIDLKAMPLEGTAYPQLVYHKWDFDLAMGLWYFGPDPGIVGVHVSSSQIQQGLAPSNVMGYDNPKVDGLLQKASEIVNRGERGKMYGEVAKILATDLPGMWFIHYRLPFVYYDKFVGLPISPQGWSGDYDEVWCKDCK